MTLSEMLLPEFDMEMANTRKLLERVPDGKFDYKPHPKSMTLGRLASHVAEMPSWATMTFKVETLTFDSSFKPFLASSTKELLETFDKHVAEGHEAIAAASDEDYWKTWRLVFNGKEMMAMPRAQVMRSMVMNHLIHHRAQLGVYLRLNDVPIVGMYGASADEPQWGS